MRRPLTLLLSALGGCSSPEVIPYHERESRQAIEAGNQFFVRGQLDLAEERFQTALKYADASDDREQRVVALNNLGMVALAQDEPEKALAAFTQCHAALAPESESTTLAEVLLHQAIAEMASSESPPTDAIAEKLERAQQLCAKLKLPTLARRTRMAQGLCWFKLSRFEEARREWESVLVEARSAEDSSTTAAALVNLAALDRESGDVRAAILKLEQALAIDKAMDDVLGIGNDLAQLSEAYEHSGDRERALDHAQRALAVHERLPNAKRAARDREAIERLRLP